ncbi:MAG: helix-turn-helix domain-containing protein [Actinomycetota bacterium]|nr:helix-turn-helix domain-containing protein [Actinomycetota bacterium]
MAPQDDEFLTLAEAAALLGMSPLVIERWAREGRLPSAVTAEGSRLFRREDLLDRWVRIQHEDIEHED